jgi:hypothetical protein
MARIQVYIGQCWMGTWVYDGYMMGIYQGIIS